MYIDKYIHMLELVKIPIDKGTLICVSCCIRLEQLQRKGMKAKKESAEGVPWS